MQVKNANVLVLGITFKENCPDVRNTKVIDILNTLKVIRSISAFMTHGPNRTKVMHEYGWGSIKDLGVCKDFDAVILAVAHNEFESLDLNSLCKTNRVIYDVKGVLSRELIDAKALI